MRTLPPTAVEGRPQPHLGRVQLPDHMLEPQHRLFPPVAVMDEGEDVGQLLDLLERGIGDLFDHPDQESLRGGVVARVPFFGEQQGDPGRVIERDVVGVAGDLQCSVRVSSDRDDVVEGRVCHERMFAGKAS